jgi:predicted ATP-dependent protease
VADGSDGTPRHPSLPADTLRWRCDPAVLAAPSTARMIPDDRWIGEERVEQAVRLALRLGGNTRHVILRGPAGTGQRTLLRQCVAAEPGDAADRRDRLYVERFEAPQRPRLLTLPAGSGRRLTAALDRFADAMTDLAGLTRSAATARLREAMRTLRAEAGPGAPRRHLTGLRGRVLEDLALLRRDDQDDARQRRTDAYRARLLRDAGTVTTRPLLELTRVDAPTLFGGITSGDGDERPGLARLRSGALLEADGGVCVIPAAELLSEPELVRRLLATLRRGVLELRPFDTSPGPDHHDLFPDPIPITTRVVVVGVSAPRLNALLEPSARRVFGVLADTGARLAWSDEVAGRVGGYLAHLRVRDGLLPLHAAAVARLIEEQVRDAEGRGKLSTRLALLADRAREAELRTRDAGRRVVTAADVDSALRARRWRAARGEEDHRQRLASGRLAVRTEGSAIGVVNGMLVYSADGYRYGAPCRITATTAVGREGVINVEREAKLSGKTFDKGVFLLVGLLRARFCQRDPMGMVAMITCEQNHGRIDGDSAAAAELAAILSDLAGAPVDQGIAVTGSVSQRGELSTVGGVNAKIEGYFATCRDRRLTGTQGVIIPRRNVEDLVLDPRIVTAVRQGSFHVWALDTIDEVLEVITGLPAGESDREGIYPADSVLGRAQRRLQQLSRRIFPPRKPPAAPKKRPRGPRTGS